MIEKKQPELPAQYLKQLRSILAEILPGRRVWLYGSRVNGTSCETSDIDLVFFPEDDDKNENDKIGEEAGKTEEIRSAFRESNIPLFVDVLSWQLIPESFRQEILNQPHIELQ